MKRNLPYIFVVIILIAALFYLKFQKNKASFSDADFKVENIEELGSIELSDKNGEKTILVFKDNRWTVDGNYPAERSRMTMLLETLNKIQVEVPVGDSIRNLAIDNLRKFSTQITLKDKDGDELKTFFIGNQAFGGNYAILSHDGKVSAEPYIIKIPGNPTDLKYHFVAKSSSWMSTEVFATQIDKIKQIKVLYSESPIHSFILDKDDDLIEVKPIQDSVKLNRQLNKQNVIQFILEFEKKHFEQRVIEDTFINIAKQAKPYATIELTDVFDKKFTINLSRMAAYSNSMQTDSRGMKLPYDIERYWGYYQNTKEYVTVQHYNFGPILRTYSYFFEQKK